MPFEAGANFFVDGQSVGAKLMWKNKMISTSLLGIRVSPTTLRPLTFSSMETTGKYLPQSRVFCMQSTLFLLADDDQYLDSTSLNNIKSLGEIKAHIREVKIGRTVPATFAPVPEAEPVHERSKKAMAHRIKYVEEPFSLCSFSVVECS